MTEIKGIILVVIVAVLASIAQILLKFASKIFALSFEGILNIYLIGGFFLLGITAVLFIVALKYGDLTVLYPILATSYIWVAVASPFIFPSDSLNTLKVLGIATIIIGIYFIARGTKQKTSVMPRVENA
jgi:drug/metabolite transporter (DMT)-like permease